MWQWVIGSTAVAPDTASLARLDELIPAVAARGDRYAAPFMVALDSER